MTDIEPFNEKGELNPAYVDANRETSTRNGVTLDHIPTLKRVKEDADPEIVFCIDFKKTSFQDLVTYLGDHARNFVFSKARQTCIFLWEYAKKKNGGTASLKDYLSLMTELKTVRVGIADLRLKQDTLAAELTKLESDNAHLLMPDGSGFSDDALNIQAFKLLREIRSISTTITNAKKARAAAKASKSAGDDEDED